MIKPSKHDIWNNFTVRDNNIATCNRCNKTMMYNRAAGISNLKKHLKSIYCNKLYNSVIKSSHKIWEKFTPLDKNQVSCNRCGKAMTYKSVNGPGNLTAHLKTTKCIEMKKSGEEVVQEEEEEEDQEDELFEEEEEDNKFTDVIVLPKVDKKLFEDVLFILENHVMLQKKSRFDNICPSIHLGIVRRRDRSMWYSVSTKKYITLYNELVTIGKKIFPKNKFTSIYILKNTVCKKHRDRNNYGPSCIISIGDYKGCKLMIENVEFNAHYTPLIFDGFKYEHWNTDDLVGNKYSIVYYSLENNITDQINEFHDDVDDIIKGELVTEEVLTSMTLSPVSTNSVTTSTTKTKCCCFDDGQMISSLENRVIFLQSLVSELSNMIQTLKKHH